MNNIIVFLFLLVIFCIPSSTQIIMCDGGGFSPTCYISSPRLYTSDHTFLGDILYIYSNITCISCSLTFNVSRFFFVAGYIEAHFVNIISDEAITYNNTNINVGTNGFLEFLSNKLAVHGKMEGTYLNIKVNGLFTLNGHISADGYGYSNSSGPGAPSSGSLPFYPDGAGGGYGGYGQNNCRGIWAGRPYGTSVNPTELGSGGSNDESYQNRGGSGGGVIFISAQSMTLNLGSLISANGQHGVSGSVQFPNGAGGGSGGSILLQTGEFFAYSARVNAKGGNGGNRSTISGKSTYAGGAGGGGRIYINSSIPLHYTINNGPYIEPMTFAGGGQSFCMDHNNNNNNISNDGTVEAYCQRGYGSKFYGCTVCLAGSYSYNGKCHPCPIGTISPTPFVYGGCNACPEGMTSNKDNTACEACASGQIVVNGNCTTCPPGTIETNGSCTACPAGTYEMSNTICLGCPNGFVSNNGSASLNCFKCATGMNISLSECLSCPANSRAENNHCIGCDQNFYSAPNSTSCSRCPSGSFGAGIGKGCTFCTPGQFIDLVRQGNDYVEMCKPCPPGQYSYTVSTACSSCPINTFNPSYGASSCISCPADSYAYSQATSCVVCPNGVYSVGRCRPMSSTNGRWDFNSDNSNASVSAPQLTGAAIGGVVLFGCFACAIVFIIQKSRRAHNNNNNNNNNNAVTNNAPNAAPVTLEMVHVDQNNLEVKSDANLSPNPFYKSNPDKDTASTGEGTCIICYDGPRNITYTPCGHTIACHECSKNLTAKPNPKCPLCRSVIRDVSRVYL